ncbi:MAG: bifunctional molybdenum cofactor biosynthesis protein MoaC/MoaB [Rickettsiaceae bacterium]|nr:bifunctional molybdenum cofactor biosynthesis protein MoaC/MoaB [Rickettsiaceae bacterium]
MNDGLDDFFSSNEYHMIDVANKLVTYRMAIAQGKIVVGKDAFIHIREKTLPKGDAVALAELAGINGAKSACNTIPLCHPLNLNKVQIKIDYIGSDSILVYCMVSAEAKTGVEMEALAGVQAALLAIYDITKMIEPALLITDIKLLYKIGGKSGKWINPNGIPEELNSIINTKSTLNQLANISVVTVTISDTISNCNTKDRDLSGFNLNHKLESNGAVLQDYSVVSDDPELIKEQLLSKINLYKPELLITTGGTGLSQRDNTYGVLQSICDNNIPGISEYMRQQGAKFTKYSWLSRSFAGIINDTLVICLPGSPKAVNQCMDSLLDLLPHAIKIIKGAKHD